MVPAPAVVWCVVVKPYSTNVVQGVREHPHRVDRQQGGHQGQESQGQVYRVPPQEEPSGTKCPAIHHKCSSDILFFLLSPPQSLSVEDFN